MAAANSGLPDADAIERRFAAQGLTGGPARDPVAVTRRLLAIQAQDLRSARLAIRARTAGLGASDVDAALDRGELVVSWLNRGTLHLIDPGDLDWLAELTTPWLHANNRRRLGELGVSERDAERGVEVVRAAVADRGPQTRAELRDAMEEAGVPVEGQATPALLLAATLAGHVVRGPTRQTSGSREQAFALREEWVGKAAKVDEEQALAELARRYLAGHGPAAPEDLAKYAAVTLGRARRGFRLVAKEIEEQPGPGELARLRRGPDPAGVPPPRMLGMFEPLLMGWLSREPVLGKRKDLVTVNGIFKAFALVDGRAAGTWKLGRRTPELEPFGRMSKAVREALAEDAEDIVRFLSS